MNEPKRKPGRPSKADIAAREQGPAMNGDTSREPEDLIELPVVEAGMQVIAEFPEHTKSLALDLAQAYAMRVWHGQSVDVTRAVRIARCKAALEGQNLPVDGVTWPEIA